MDKVLREDGERNILGRVTSEENAWKLRLIQFGQTIQF